MSTNDFPQTPECAMFAPLLPLLGSGGLSESEERALRLHLAGCLHCRHLAVAYETTASAVRRHVGLEATSTPYPLVTFADIQSAVAQDALPSALAPLRDTTRSSRRALSGIAALAAVLLIALLAQELFSSHPRPGPTSSLSPALAHALVVVGTSDGLYAIHAGIGTLAWRFPAVASRQETSPFTVGCLALASEVIYACSLDGIIAVSATGGTLLWHRSFPGTMPIPSASNASSFASLGIATANGAVYVSTIAGEGLTSGAPLQTYETYALNASTGDILWTHAAKMPIRSAPVAGNGVVYVATTFSVDALRAGDGSLLWTSLIGGGAAPEGTSSTGVFAAAITATPGSLYVSTAENISTRPATAGGSASLIATPVIYQISARDGSHIWKSGYPSCPCMTPYPAMVAEGHVFYAEDDSLWQLSTTSMAPGWRFTGYGQLVGPAMMDGMLYLTDTGQDPNTRDTDTLAVDPSTGHELWRTGTQGGTLSKQPGAAGGAIFSGGSSILYALRADTGAILWRYQTGADLHTTAPVVSS